LFAVGARCEEGNPSDETPTLNQDIPPDPPPWGAFAEHERVRDLSREVSNQTDDTILRESARLGPLVGQFLQAARAHIAPTVTTQSLAELLLEECRRADLAPAMLGYQGFPAGVAISINDEIVHGIPSSRALQRGDLVKIELAVVSGKAFAAQSWTFPVGPPSATDAPMLAAGRTALTHAVNAVSPRARLGDIGAAIQTTTEAAGFSVVRAYVGYGMGKQRLQQPQVSGFGRAGTGSRLLPGMILNIHVIIKQGSFEVAIAPNKWTAMAVDGLRGALFTAMVEVTAGGRARLTNDLDM